MSDDNKQNVLMGIIVVFILCAPSIFSWLDTPSKPAVLPIIEKAKQDQLSDSKFNELYREGKRLTTFGDSR